MDTTFIDALASASPTPGGGGACAACGACACALAEMVGNLTVGKKKYAAVELEVKQSLSELSKLRAKLIELVSADAEAFEPLACAYKMPKETKAQQSAKNEAMQKALTRASEVPLEIMQTTCKLLEHISFLAHNGSLMAISDAGVAAAFAKAAVEGASLNVYINVKSLENKQQAQQYKQEADACVQNTKAAADEVFSFVKKSIQN